MLSSIARQYDVPTNKLYALRQQIQRRGRRLIDLISGNVNAQGIHFPSAIMAKAFTTGLNLANTYRPNPLGQESARAALSRYYAAQHVIIPSHQLLLTPGTSVSYWYAFKVLADRGDEILCPAPSYPLFDSIAALCEIKLVSYKLEERARWEINFEHLESVVTSRTRAIVLISPHNPTGAVATEDEVLRLASIAARKRLAIISDEVFSPFLSTRGPLARPAATRAPLVFTLNGFSKMLALPGLKIGWMAVSGDPSLVKKTIKALDMISDTFLPVNEMAQFAVPSLLEDSKSFQESYSSKIRRRMQGAASLLKSQRKISFVEPEGGFFLALRLEGNKQDEEEMACRLLQKHGILVHPGYFYDMEGSHLVLSFVNRPAVLTKALHQVVDEIKEGQTR